MTDKELLELAAKAAGIELMPMQINNVTKQGDDRFIGYMTKADEWPRGWFDPLTNNGDALRLAVKLKIDIKHYDDYVVGWFDGGYIGTGKIMYEGDPYAATRRAISRAAAEIGKEMP
jgi:hypothetical protein